MFLKLCAGADEEAFEDNSEEYIIRDLEGSGMNLISFFPEEMLDLLI